MSDLRVTTKAELLASIAQCSLHAPHVVPLISAAYHDVISFAAVVRGRSAPLRVLDRSRAPSVVLIGDDCADGFDPGPLGWPNVQRMARWAKLAVINATGGVRQHYDEFVQLALCHRKLLVIETGTARADQWLEVCQATHTPTVVIKPEDGGVQPVMLNRGAFH